jgi:hypothetical protein
MPVPAVIGGGDGSVLGEPDHYVGRPATNLVVTSGASIDFDGPRSGDGDHFIIVAIRTGFDPSR